MARVSNLVNLVRDNLNLLHVGDDMKEDSVIFHLELCQAEIAQRGVVLQGDAVVSTVADTAKYDLEVDIFRLVEVIEPTDWRYDVGLITNIKQWKRVLRDTSLTTGAIQPLYAFLWDNQVRFHPAPTSIVTVEFLTSRLPSLELIVANPVAGISTVNPEIPRSYDTALYYGTMGRILASIPYDKNKHSIGDFKQLFEDELASIMQTELKRQLIEPDIIDSSEERLGF